jgi:hypothetical protein
MPLDGLKELMDNLQAFDFGQEMEEIVADNPDKLTELQREQMLKGRGVDGEYIRPFYSENPYFKRPGAAARYAAWKQRITPNSERPEDVPNLTINDTFHNSLSAVVEGRTFDFDTSVDFGEKVFDVHKNAKGLDEDSRLEFAETITLPEIKDRLLAKTGLEITNAQPE